jgi:hypothetical protein
VFSSFGRYGFETRWECYQSWAYLCTKYVAFIIIVYCMVLTSEASCLGLSKVNNGMQGFVLAPDTRSRVNSRTSPPSFSFQLFSGNVEQLS